MAYVSTEKKAKIAEALKKVVPSSWKYSLAVRHHSTLRMTIYSAPVDLIGLHKWTKESGEKTSYLQLNNYHLDKAYEGELLATFLKIKEALNTDNYDKSDIQSDYFDVGHYVDIHLGAYNRPFEVKGGKSSVKNVKPPEVKVPENKPFSQWSMAEVKAGLEKYEKEHPEP